MKKLILIFGIALLIANCQKKENDIPEKLLGNDYKLFENTPVKNLALAVQREDILKITEEAQKNRHFINYQEKTYGNTLLMLAINNNDYRSVDALLKIGADPNIHDHYRGGTAVIFAAENDDPKYLRSVLEYHGDPNAIENIPYKEDDKIRQTALLAAISTLDTGSLKKVKLLIRAGAHLNYHSYGHTNLPLSEAIMLDRLDVALYLLQNDADFNLMLYKTINGEKIYILKALRKCIIDLQSEQYKNKLEVIKFLKGKGLDYNKEPIPDYILVKIKKKYPDSWEEFASKY
ncbi:ankyrin repeat domain-containing protein [Flavobacterium sp. MAH-1]|uniref:Ankyrin repeat domain-containing protein n=1 Tax=Flavobacterium agri TaxID=2743471 RepID=A0A7Y8Y3H1_9FLAO|nr:ankyrin repeat domain-containing protein [Flavobacterium agri]NUY81910.1 ankyrin repeat domain-containing protein [Flavobacterium agri]NYA71934.1 ankyrin repeat domain-containing protein [Flavobacterium agri]